MAEQKKKKQPAPPAEEAQESCEAQPERETAQQPAEEAPQPGTGEGDALRQENEELKNQLLRLRAEFDNFKKRTAREKDELYNYAKADSVEAVLGVLDNFERALQADCADDGFKQGVEMIFHQFQEALNKLGVEEIPALGEPFDPQIHNAVNQVEDENFGENTVCQVFQKGYRLGGRVIRHSMVVVANP